MPRIALLPGDGVGPEVVAEAVRALQTVASRAPVSLTFESFSIGGEALDRFGVPLRDPDLRAIAAADAVLLGAVGGPRWDAVDSSLRPERGLLKLRQALKLFANIRPVSIYPSLVESSPLKGDVVTGVDLVVVRELTGGIYFGKPSRRGRSGRGRSAVDTLRYSEVEIERVVRFAFALAQSRRKKVASVDKANVLQSSRLWREVVEEVAAQFPDVECEHVLVDAMAMHLVTNPRRFDVVVTENMFGDILTDEASVVTGSIGLLPSASVGAKPGPAPGTRFGLYEPIHGSAPDIAGRGIANPTGAILSAAMLLRWSLGLPKAARLIEDAVADTSADGARTRDIAEPGRAPLTTGEFGGAVIARIAGTA